MTEYFILTKRKGLKNWEGVVPTKKGVSLKNLRDSVTKNRRSGFVLRIITKSQLSKLLLGLKPKGAKLKLRGRL